MTTKEQKIKAIYEKIANKELSFGCKYSINGSIEIFDGEYSYCKQKMIAKTKQFCENCPPVETMKISRIIGHPVMIGDVLDWIEKNIINKNSAIDFSLKLILLDFRKKDYLWKYKSKPIEEQSDECIDYIYNLISDND